MREADIVEEALQVKHEVSRKKENNRKLYPSCKYCGKKGHPPYKCWRRPNARCSKCNELGHEDVICEYKNKEPNVDAQVADGEEEEDQLFVASCFSSKSNTCGDWLIDSGCTNHMTHDKNFFRDLRSTSITKVRIGNGEFITVQGKGTIAIPSCSVGATLGEISFLSTPKAERTEKKKKKED
ncbi:Retrovirus-related Pol polyprotein from transposon TNT 1-94 [Senna tora]|uniref:Retrovirus-related Pol polyprotein from transposon TNT 1-94 n=1 Tax=Senna tora TaxID=362788 RepID=A0A834W8V8_9FABA|nr:Retrovirus-related Pol polyprotein from transposon TNT 1-94 [Senna tora]